jgi:eukaryotic-like serine/threonine-protein kinase
LIALAGAGVYFGTKGSGPKPAAPAAVVAGPVTPADPVEAAKTTLNEQLPSVACTWLEVGQVGAAEKGVLVELRGVAGNPAASQSQIAQLLAANQIPVSAIGGRITVPQREFEMAKLDSGSLAGTIGAKALVNFNLTDPKTEVALFGLDPSGKISQITKNRSELVGVSEDLGNNQYRLPLDVNHEGWSGLLLLSGTGSFDGNLLDGPAGSHGGDWSQRFLAKAQTSGWKSEMVWFKTVDAQPN